MIYDVIQTITDGLNVFFKTRLRTIEDKAVISGIVNQDGSVALLEENKVLITLVSIEKEPTTVGPKKDGKQRVHINFYLLFSCYFSNANYSEALKFLDFTMNFLNDNSSMDITEGGGAKSTSSSGGLKVQIEIESLSLDQTSNLWSTIGAKLMPSALYKVRMIPLDSSSLTEFRPSAAVLSSNTKETGGGNNNNQGTGLGNATGGTGPGNTNNGGNNQTSNTVGDTAPAATTTPPPSSPANEPKNTKGKRPIILGGAYVSNDNDDDDDDDDDEKDDTVVPEQNTNTPAMDFNSSPTDSDNSAAIIDEESALKDQPENKESTETDKKDDTNTKDSDILDKLNPTKKNQGSLFSPFSLPKKPEDPNIKASDSNINKGSNNNLNDDPNKNLNKNPDDK